MSESAMRAAYQGPIVVAHLRRNLVRQTRWLLLAVVLMVGGFLTLVVHGIGNFGTLAMVQVVTQDSNLRSTFLFVAFALGMALVRKDRAWRSWLRRMPVSPKALLQARLQIAMSLAVVVLLAVFGVEYFAAPKMLRPSFANRLNPVEVETFERLPGIPLLRWQVDGEVNEGLASAISLAALRSQGPWAYGRTRVWSQAMEKLPPVRPGEMLSRMNAEDWAALTNYRADWLIASGAAHGSTIEVSLVRWLSVGEYRQQNWRRDGLLRSRSWAAAIDRAVGLLGLVWILVCLFSAGQSPRVGPGNLVSLVSICLISSGALLENNWFRPLLFSDLRRGVIDHGVSIPSLSTHFTAIEYLLWPALVLLTAAASYAFTAYELSRQARGGRLWPGLSVPQPVVQRLSMRLSRGSYQRSSQRSAEWLGSAVILALFLYIVIYNLPGNFGGRSEGLSARFLSIFGLGVATVTLADVWFRRDALLSRLPVAPGRLAGQRLAVFLLCCGFFAVVSPWLIGQLPVAIPSSSQGGHGGAHFSREDAFFLTRFGAVPVLEGTGPVPTQSGDRLVGDLNCYSYPGHQPASRFGEATRAWQMPEGEFLPRGDGFRLAFEVQLDSLSKSQAEAGGLAAGTRIDYLDCQFEVVRLLDSKSEVEAFLAQTGVSGRGLTPGPQYTALAISIALVGLVVMSAALWCFSQHMLLSSAVLAMLLTTIGDRLAWLFVIGPGDGVPPWWTLGVGAALLAVFIPLFWWRLKQRIERGFQQPFRIFEVGA